MRARSVIPAHVGVLYVLLVIASLIVAASTLAAVTGRDAGMNTLMTLLAGGLTGLVVVAAFAGYGRSSARVRVMGLGLVVSAISGIQLAQLWGDGLAARAWLAGSMLIVVGVLGVACFVLGSRMVDELGMARSSGFGAGDR